MLTDFARDHAFTIAWFGLMAFVWFGWAQEDPSAKWRAWLGAGSGAGVLLSGPFGYAVVLRWNDGSALEGLYPWFGALTLAEVSVAALGCLVLRKRQRDRWMAWWVALIVALHFIPLAFFLRDWSLTALGGAQAAGLLVALPTLRTKDTPTSRVVGPIMGVSLLAFAVLSVVVFVATSGSPW